MSGIRWKIGLLILPRFKMRGFDKEEEMTSVSGIVGGGTGVVPTTLTSSSSSTQPSTSQSTTTAAHTSQKLVSVPLARIIVTEFLDNSGNIASQIPSSTVVAYLQNGLSADGSPKQSSVA